MAKSAPRVELPNPRRTAYGMLRNAPFEGDPELPDAVDVVVIGGGVCGTATANYLARRGLSVLICEKAEIGCEASSRAFGWISELQLDPAKMEMVAESKRLWPELHADAGETGYRRHGLVQFADDAITEGHFEAWLDSVKGQCDAGTRLLTSDEVAERFPTAQRRFRSGLYAPSDGSAEPVIVSSAIAGAARRAGARIVTGCAVGGLDLAGGRVAGVFTERGYVRTSAVLCAANFWSRIFCGNHGVDLPQLYVVMSMARTHPLEGPVGAGGQDLWGFREQIDGSYSLGGVSQVEVPITRDAFALRKAFTMGGEEMPPVKISLGRTAWADFRLARKWDPRGRSPFEKNRVFSGRTAKGYAEGTLRRNSDVFPEFAVAGIAEDWSGVVTITPDDMPIAGAIEQIPGFYVLTGCSYGITWAPALGKMLADIISGAPTSLDPKPFSLARFSAAI